MAIIKYKDKDGNLVPLGASGDHTHSPESIGAAKKNHGHNVATEDSDGFMSSADKATIAELNDVVFGNENQEGLKDLVGEGTVADRIAAAIADKVVKDGSKVLSTNDYTNEEKDKLKNIDEGANKYEHPAYTERNSGLYKITIDGTGHVSDVVTVVKKDITDLGIPTEDTTYNNATQSAPGLMSVDDKKKLDGIDPGATKVTVDGTLSSSSTNPVQNKVVQSAIKDLNDLVGETPVADRIEASISKLIKALSVSGTTITYTMVDGTTGTIKTQDTDTTYNVMTGASSSANGASGLVPQPTKGNQSKFLRADGTWQTPYTHPTTAGNKHIPSGGASGQFLKWSADGTATWASAPTIAVDNSLSSTSTNPVQNNVIYTALSGKASSSHGNHVPTTQTADNAVFLRNDNSWQTVTPENIGAATYKVMSSTDFNTMITPGFYTMSQSSSNAPTSGNYHSLIVNKSDTGQYIQQMAIKESTYETYVRYCSGGTWSEWKRLALAEEVGGSSVDVFSTSANGLVPKPSSASAAYFLNASGEWSTPYSIQAQETSSKRFLVGTDDQSTNAYTSSNRNCYMENGRLYSGASMVITADMMQTGAHTVSSIAAGVGEFFDHTFSVSYADAPYFVVSNNTYDHNISVVVASLTNSGFTIKINNNGSSTATNVRVSWIAIGTPAS